MENSLKQKVKENSAFDLCWMENVKDADFGVDHILKAGKIAGELANSRKFEELGRFMKQFTGWQTGILKEFDHFRKALIALKLHRKCFQEVYALIEEGVFQDPEGLLDIWDQAHYQEKELELGQPLNSLKRFRVRKRNHPPRSILPSGIRPTPKLPEHARSILVNWLKQHASKPYPSRQEKVELAWITGLSDFQVKTWFANARRRMKTKKRQEFASFSTQPCHNKSIETLPISSFASTGNSKQKFMLHTNNEKFKSSVKFPIMSSQGSSFAQQSHPTFKAPDIGCSMKTTPTSIDALPTKQQSGNDSMSSNTATVERLKKALESAKERLWTVTDTVNSRNTPLKPDNRNINSASPLTVQASNQSASSHNPVLSLDKQVNTARPHTDTGLSNGQDAENCLSTKRENHDNRMKDESRGRKSGKGIKFSTRQAKAERKRLKALHVLNLQSLLNVKKTLQDDFKRMLKNKIMVPKKFYQSSDNLQALRSLCDNIEKSTVSCPLDSVLKTEKCGQLEQSHQAPTSISEQDMACKNLVALLSKDFENDDSTRTAISLPYMTANSGYLENNHLISVDQSAASLQACSNIIGHHQYVPETSMDQSQVGSEVMDVHTDQSQTGSKFTWYQDVIPEQHNQSMQSIYQYISGQPITQGQDSLYLVPEQLEMYEVYKVPTPTAQMLPWDQSDPRCIPRGQSTEIIHPSPTSDTSCVHVFHNQSTASETDTQPRPDLSHLQSHNSYRQLLMSQDMPSCYGYFTDTDDVIVNPQYSSVSSPSSVDSDSSTGCMVYPYMDENGCGPGQQWVVRQPWVTSPNSQRRESGEDEADAVQGLLCLSSQSPT